MNTQQAIQDQLRAQILTDAGLIVDEIDRRRPVDIVVWEIAGQLARHVADQRRYAAAIAKDMTAVAEGAIGRHPLTATSDLMHYDATIASINALREPLAAAVYAVQHARTTEPA